MKAFEFFKSKIHEFARQEIISLGRFSYVHDDDIINMTNISADYFGKHLSVTNPNLLPRDKHYYGDNESMDIIKKFLLGYKTESTRIEILKGILGWPIPPDISEQLYLIGLAVFRDTSLERSIKLVNLIYEKFYDDYGHLYGHYFRNMHHILIFISNSKMKDKYRKIYRAQLSRYELFALFVNYCTSFAGNVFVENVQKMHILDGIYIPDLFFSPKDINAIIDYRCLNHNKLYPN